LTRKLLVCALATKRFEEGFLPERRPDIAVVNERG
jgi:hypothetical protein